MIGIPKRFAAADLPAFAGIETRRTAKALDAVPFGDAIDPADCADAAIALEHSFAEMSGITTQLPFLDAKVGAEGNAAGWNFQIAPAAKVTAVWPFRQSFAIGTAAGHSSLFAYRLKCVIHDVRSA